MCRFSGVQTHARISSSPDFIFMMTKPDAAVEELFHKKENKHKQRSKDLEIQRLNFVLPYICGLGAFKSQKLLFARAFWRKVFPWLCSSILGLSADLHSVFLSCVNPEVLMCIYFTSRDGNAV